MGRLGTIMAVLIIGPGHLGLAGESVGPATQTVVLQPVQGPGLRINLDFRFQKAVPPFDKEPPFAGKEVARGWIPTVPPTAFIRNVTDNELYLNVHHDEDFITSPPVTYKGHYDGHVVFQGLRVSTLQGSMEIPYEVSQVTYEHGCSGWLWVRSAWAAALTTEGIAWTLGVVDNLDGRIDSNDILFVRRTDGAPGRPLMMDCPVPEVLSWAGHTWRLGFRFVPDPCGAVVEATLTEFDQPMGQLILEAKGTRCLRLRDERAVVLLETKAGTVSVPAGTYRIEDVILDSNSNDAVLPRFAGSDRQVPVQPGETSILRIGTPLSHTVEVCRDKNLLRLTYQLIGSGGENYSYYDWRHRPSLAIYKGPLEIAGGVFPFG